MTFSRQPEQRLSPESRWLFQIRLSKFQRTVSVSHDLLMTSLMYSIRFSNALGIHPWLKQLFHSYKPLDVHLFFFNSQCFFWLVVRERRAQPQTILLVQMQQTFQGVAKVLLESSGRFKVHNDFIMFNNNNNNDWFVISMHLSSCGCMQKVANKHNRSYSERW